MVDERSIKAGIKGVFCLILCIFTFSLFCRSLLAHSDGAPLGCVGSGVDKVSWLFEAPGNFTCGITACHYQYSVGSGKGKFMLFVLDRCEPGEVMDILVSFKQTDTDFHGFQIAAHDKYFNRSVGTFLTTGDDAQTQAGGRFATHTKMGTNQRYWHVKWQAPPEDFCVANPVRFFAVGVESNNDGTPMGDFVYTTNRTIVVKPKKITKEKVRVYMKE